MRSFRSSPDNVRHGFATMELLTGKVVVGGLVLVALVGGAKLRQDAKTASAMQKMRMMGMGGKGKRGDKKVVDDSETIHISSLALLKMLKHGRIAGFLEEKF